MAINATILDEMIENPHSNMTQRFIELLREVQDVPLDWIIERMWSHREWLLTPEANHYVYGIGPIKNYVMWTYFNRMPIEVQWEVAIAYDFMERMYHYNDGLTDLDKPSILAECAILWEAYRCEDEAYILSSYIIDGAWIDEWDRTQDYWPEHSRCDIVEDGPTGAAMYVQSYKGASVQYHIERMELSYREVVRDDGSIGCVYSDGCGEVGLLGYYFMDIDYVIRNLEAIKDTMKALAAH